jgi:hypothetical protein
MAISKSFSVCVYTITDPQWNVNLEPPFKAVFNRSFGGKNGGFREQSMIFLYNTIGCIKIFLIVDRGVEGHSSNTFSPF